MVYKVAVSNLNLNKTFLYSSQIKLEIGERVLIDFNGNRRVGYIVQESNEKGAVKSIIERIDGKSFLEKWRVKILLGVSNFFGAPVGKLFDLCFPKGLDDYFVTYVKSRSPFLGFDNLSVESFISKYGKNKLNEFIKQGIVEIVKDFTVRTPRPKKELFVKLISNLEELAYKRLTKKQLMVVNYLLSTKVVSYEELKAELNINLDVVYQLKRKGIVEIFEERIEQFEKIQLTNLQKEVVNEIINNPGMHLLMGVTGSGKTEVYIEVMKHYLKMGKVLYLVPETSLIEQTSIRIKTKIPDAKLGVYHSYLTKAKRVETWIKAVKGDLDILLGTRSAVFVPLKDISLVIVDEFHDESYYQDSNITYDTIKILEEFPVPVIFGSATPRIEHYYKAKKGIYYFHRLTERFGTTLPTVEIINMKIEDKVSPYLSKKVLDEIAEVVKKNEEVMVFVRRKGFSRIVCQNCGYFVKCPNCETSLTYYKSKGILKCHICGYEQSTISACPSCGSIMLLEKGTGTERMEKELVKHFPGRQIARADTDLIFKPKLFEKLLKKLILGEIDILVGTKMITKGLDIPKVSLTVVADIDAIATIPDYNSELRAFQLLVQVTGRSGRKAPGKAVIQTYYPESDILKYAINQDVESFYEIEIKKRRALNYPPFSNIVHIITSSQNQALGYETAKKIVEELKKSYNDPIIGPTEYLIPKIRNNYLYHFIVKTSNPQKVINNIEQLKNKYPTKLFLRVNPPSILTYLH
ncbi:primosomal protein N' [Thermosipho ferrireducens]|uniref:Replication restart protein PriA n=1 Tax=Thermosipho ferrireducens TaxID=2571116 RepID=A0ABX7S730_9BACT|nr:primosomal protein N' [Thermosipho ferrireducens]QTA38392.1 primosomal protein N' [Thermosipho ferrireducens]